MKLRFFKGGRKSRKFKVTFILRLRETGPRFWKIHKKSWKLKGILSRNGVVPFFHPAFQYKDTFM